VENNPFKETAQEYFDKGWLPVPLPYRKKANPPGGYTGRSATKKIDQKTINRWLKTSSPQNIAIKIPDDMIGLDVDNYEGHDGANTLIDLEKKHGTLPGTCVVTSRADGISGIRLFKVPPGLAWSGKYGPGIDIIQAGHRYAVAWPSIHPEGRVYSWHDGVIPSRDEVADLPAALVEELSQGVVGEVLIASDVSTKEANDWLNALPGGRLCWEVHGQLEKIRDDIVSNRHDTMKSGQWALMKLGIEGHRGVRKALAELKELFFEQILGDAEREQVAGHEFFSALNSGVKKNYEVDKFELCECGAVPQLSDSEPAESKAKKRGRLELESLEDIEMEATTWLWQDRIPAGTVCVLTGRGDVGKSMVSISWTAWLTRGKMDGIFKGLPKSVIIMATEDIYAQHIKPRLVAADADLKRVWRVKPVEEFDNVVLPRDIAELTDLIITNDVAMVIMDPLLSRIDTRLDTHKDADVRRALEPLKKMAELTNAVVLGFVHFNKGTSKDAIDRVSASGALTTVPRSVFAVVKEDEEVRVLGQVKNNLGTPQPDLAFTIESAYLGTDRHGNDINTGKVVWKGESETTFQEIMDGPKRPSGARNRVQEWLADYLQTQARCVPSSEVKAAAEKAGFSEGQINSARKALDVEIVRTKTVPSSTCWEDAANKLMSSMMEDDNEQVAEAG
jgi:bifunctional DNA primase/polymerase-like protein/AAA domain-containing protein